MKKAPIRDRDVAWTEELLGEVWSWRGRVSPEFQREELEEARDVKKCFASRRDYAKSDASPVVGGKRFDTRLRLGITHVDGRLRAMSERAIAIYDERGVPKEPLDVDAEIAAVALEIIPTFAAYKCWVAKEGLSFALRAISACHSYWSSARRHGYGGPIWLMNDDSESHSRPEYADSAWLELRAALALADDATYAKLRDEARAIRKTAPPVVQSMIAVAFTTERDWADEAAASAIARGNRRSGWETMLLTVASVALGAELVRTPSFETSEDALLTLMAREGSAAAPVVIAALETASNNAFRKRYAKLLAMIESEEVATAFAAYIANKTVGPIAMKYFVRVPEISRRALTPLSRGSSMQARGAAMALRTLG